ncbi:hypothetical protein JR316_0009394 [Psilocybe cubensis]|uniref:Uncharacterized protein n=1 Tax=Psilocybe cubensis TaxID=181762 RepID=A0ACB8GUN0_PSICU|nr:hypothetical protein JR316_0009394 [Psilocybe cubensis]KAH9478931.1 hypothetical protein JR316_0009394 [Psilocybe cubensis]
MHPLRLFVGFETTQGISKMFKPQPKFGMGFTIALYPIAINEAGGYPGHAFQPALRFSGLSVNFMFAERSSIAVPKIYSFLVSELLQLINGLLERDIITKHSRLSDTSIPTNGLGYTADLEDSLEYLVIPPYSELPFGPDTVHYYLPRRVTNWPDSLSLEVYPDIWACHPEYYRQYSGVGDVAVSQNQGQSHITIHERNFNNTPSGSRLGDFEQQPSVTTQERQNMIFHTIEHGHPREDTECSGNRPVERNEEYIRPTTAQSARGSSETRPRTRVEQGLGDGRGSSRGAESAPMHSQGDDGAQIQRHSDGSSNVGPDPHSKGRIDAFGRSGLGFAVTLWAIRRKFDEVI